MGILASDIVEWCRKNCTKGEFLLMRSTGYIVEFAFKNEDEAIMFKLRFSNGIVTEDA